jgi:hypothetical protein
MTLTATSTHQTAETRAVEATGADFDYPDEVAADVNAFLASGS